MNAHKDCHLWKNLITVSRLGHDVELSLHVTIDETALENRIHTMLVISLLMIVTARMVSMRRHN